MKIDLNTLCEKVEAAVTTARALPITDATQIIVTFANRPDVEIALLTPYQQNAVRTNSLDAESVSLLLQSVRTIAEYNILKLL